MDSTNLVADPAGGGRLRLAETARIHPLGEETAVVADHARLRLQGGFAEFFRSRLAPLLDGRFTETEICAELSDVDEQGLRSWLRRLVDAGVLDEVRPEGPVDGGLSTAEPFFRSLRLDRRGREVLAALHVGVVGLNRTGAAVVKGLFEFGVGTVTVIDPLADSARGPLLNATGGTLEVGRELDRDGMLATLKSCDLVIHAWGRQHLASAHWVNQRALATGTRAIFCSVTSHEATVGPLVLPGESSCFLCTRMRSIATSTDYELSIADEAWVQNNGFVLPHEESALPQLATMAGAVAALESTKITVGFGTPALVDHLWEFNALTLNSRLRPVLQHPQCPACRKKGRPPPPQPTLSELRGAVDSPADLLGSAGMLIDPRTGLITELREVPRDASEPALPIVVRAQLANHRFVTKDNEPFTVASGKGMTAEQARTGAIGEGIERYGAYPRDPDRIIRAAATQLAGPYISPTDLVTYTDDQYDHLPYARWDPSTVTDWVTARRLTDGSDVRVPALGTFIDFEVAGHAEFYYPVTSNGLAAGPTLARAVLGGLLELIERDAFLLSWFGRRPGTSIDPFRCGDADVAAVAAAYRRRGVDLKLNIIPTECPVTVCVALGVDSRSGADRPALVIGLGADSSPTIACRKSALEVGQVRPALRARMRDPFTQRRLAELIDNPMNVTELDDHDLLFADASQLTHVDFWLDAPRGDIPLAPGDGTVAQSPGGQLAAIVNGLKGAAVDVAYVNLTPPDLAGLGFSTVRVHAPGLQPIHFGATEARLGNPRLRRIIGPDINLYPHPLA